MDRILMIGRGINGWHASGVSSGNRFSSTGGTLEHYLSSAQDGAWVYDADEADIDAFAHLVISGPLTDPTLEPGTVSKFGESAKKTLLGMLPGLGGAFKALGALALADIGSLDSVAPDVWIAMLREKVPGAKIGRVERGSVVWEG